MPNPARVFRGERRHSRQWMREAAKKLEIQYKNHTVGTVTLSAGVATFHEHGDSSEELLKAADQCLYQSKAEGRDRLTVATGRSARDLG